MPEHPSGSPEPSASVVPTGTVVDDGAGVPSTVGIGVLVVDVDVQEAATTTIARRAQRVRTMRRYT